MLQIKDLETILAKAGVPVEIACFPGTQVPYIVLGPEADPAFHHLDDTPASIGSLVFINDILHSIGHATSAIDQLQLTLTLPLTLPATRLRDCSQCLAAINQRLVLGNMGLNGEGMPYYRYHWQVFERQFSSETLLTSVEKAYQQVALYRPRLQALASGEISLASALNFDPG